MSDKEHLRIHMSAEGDATNLQGKQESSVECEKLSERTTNTWIPLFCILVNWVKVCDRTNLSL